MIVGIDEVGRGAWAGPLVVGAVIMGEHPIIGLTDSKKLTKKQRILLDQEIRKTARAIGLGWVSAKQIDQIGLSAALKLAATRALMHIRSEYSEIIIDGTVKLIDDPRVTTMKKADLLIPSVSAASIIAKVARDNYMTHCDTIFPGYTFSGHVGYGTAVHRDALNQLGVSPLHRQSFAPIAEQMKYARSSVVKTEKPAVRTSRQIGDTGENAAADYLEKRGQVIIERNWKTKVCEIDIISSDGVTLYFGEVKYRKNANQGGGLAAITPKKLKQMKFAAEIYLKSHTSKEKDVRLVALSVEGTPATVTEYVEII